MNNNKKKLIENLLNEVALLHESFHVSLKNGDTCAVLKTTRNRILEIWINQSDYVIYTKTVTDTEKHNSQEVMGWKEHAITTESLNIRYSHHNFKNGKTDKNNFSYSTKIYSYDILREVVYHILDVYFDTSQITPIKPLVYGSSYENGLTRIEKPLVKSKDLIDNSLTLLQNTSVDLSFLSTENLRDKTMKELIPTRDILLINLENWFSKSEYKPLPIKSENRRNGIVVHKQGSRTIEFEVYVQNGKDFSCTIRICTNIWKDFLHNAISDNRREEYHDRWNQKTEFYLTLDEFEKFIHHLSGYDIYGFESKLILLDDSHTEDEIRKHADSLSIDDLRKAAKERSTDKPKEITINVKQYIRDGYVSEEAKKRAGGICQLCGNKAPFNRADGEPYLETHHIVWLSNGGADSPENTVALCPNCHRKMHIVADPEDVKILQSKVYKS